MDARNRIDDICKRKLKRIKVSSIEHPFKCPPIAKNTKWKLHPLQLVLFITVLCIFIMMIWYQMVSYDNSTFDSVSRWIWHSSDLRYVSNAYISSDEISRALNQVQGYKFRGIGLLNFNEKEIHQWQQLIPGATHTVLHLEYVAQNVTWDSLYPEWIDEEQEHEVPSCPSLPTLEVPRKRLDLIAVKLPCQNNKNWSRDIARLHLQIAVARLAVSYKGNYIVHLLFVTQCFPMPSLFCCNELVVHDGSTWLYRPNLNSLRQKIRLPIGSCELALPVGGPELDYSIKRQREAYATILHSAYVYVCGAIVAAQSIRKSGSTRDLVILVDESISDYHRSRLELAGWQVRTIRRIRNLKAKKDAYNEWNYSKFRLWQLTDYDKIIFIDADMLILRNIDFLFAMPEISATGNDGSWFNSGVMVIEPSNCTFKLLYDHINVIKSYNGGDQGYLNEVFAWWHRLPKDVNFLKHFWIHDGTATRQKKVRLLGSEPPEIYVIHYLGNKPWMCFKDYDCNWNVEALHEFASDTAHARWWKVHDKMASELQEACLLRAVQKAQLEWDRRKAEKRNYSDGHWKREVSDERLVKCIDKDCDWKERLRHWGQRNKSASPAF